MAESIDAQATFLADLAELRKRHGYAIGGCGCCGSPWVEKVDEDKRDGSYGVSGGTLVWAPAPTPYKVKP